MTNYFQTYQESPPTTDELDLARSDRPRDPSGPFLPFDLLGDRVFEVLVYQLKCIEYGKNGHVVLMQGTGDRGRDIVVFQNGSLAQLVQCKNYKGHMNLPELRRELLKLALFASKELHILGTTTIKYELWCPGGLTEPAANLFPTWPSGWDEFLLKEDAAKLVRKYASFSELDWDDVRSFVMDQFPKLLQVKSLGCAAITTLVRDNHKIYESFFDGHVVMRRDDVKEAMNDSLKPILDSIQYLNDDDAKHIVDRILSFPEDERYVCIQSFVFGIKPELLAKFRGKEFEEFTQHVMEGVYDLIGVVMNACARIQLDYILEFRRVSPPRHNAVAGILGGVLTYSMIAKLQSPIFSGLNLKHGITQYTELLLEERFRSHTEATWDSFQNCLSGYDSRVHPDGSDEKLRHRIAVIGLQGASSKEIFVDAVMTAFNESRNDIQAVYDRWMDIIPSQMMLVSDTKSAFQNPVMFKRMVEVTQRMAKIRGSAIIPE